MEVTQLIEAYISNLPEAKRQEISELHSLIRKSLPDSKLWYLDGKDSAGKIVSNPNIGYGSQIIKYADGKTKEFYQIGLSANTSGISVYIIGLEDKQFLSKTYKDRLGKASISGYCIKFKSLKNINIEVLLEAIQHGFHATKA
jgi:hypothetical protein